MDWIQIFPRSWPMNPLSIMPAGCDFFQLQTDIAVVRDIQRQLAVSNTRTFVVGLTPLRH